MPGGPLGFMRLIRAGILHGMALAVGVSSVEYAAGVGRMCTGSEQGAAGSGLLVA